MVLYFNIEDYDKFLELLAKLKISELNEFNRKGFYFMLGHIYFHKNDYLKCTSYFKKCENYFIKNNYSYDLTVLYQDLYAIKQIDDYNERYLYYKESEGKKNIMVP
jgi:tetratricopeptide (TPR) repeat protein